tara:strand:- start:202 stop:855 length:654 start_codon:yes stop_codon:yes gene_type:complete
MKKLMFVLLFTLPLIGFSQNIYNEDDLKFNQDSSLMLLKSNDTPVSGIVKRTCKRKGVILKIKTNCEEYYENGLWMSSKGYYKNKQISQELQRNGMSIFYYKNGEIEYMGSYKDGLENGAWKYLNKQGDLEKEETWEEGEIITEKGYNKNGLLKYELEWKNENSYIIKDYYKGVLYEEGTIKNGKKEGVWKQYVFLDDGTTELDKKIIFKNGKKVEN